MKKNMMIITTAALLAVIGLATSCVAVPPYGGAVDPTQFVDLLDESGATPVDVGQIYTNQPLAEAPVTAAGSQVGRLLEESELILRGIAAEAEPAREELQKSSMDAMDVIQSYIDRLPPRPSVSTAAAESATNTLAAPVAQVVVPESPAEVAVDWIELQKTEMTAPESEALVPSYDIAQPTLDEALRELVVKLRGVATELERLSKPLEGLNR